VPPASWRAITSSRISGDLNILLTVISHLNVHAADILLINPATWEFEASAWRGFHTGSVTHFPQQLREGLGRRVAREKRALFIPSLSEAVDTLEVRMLMRNEGFVAYYGIPLIAKEQLVGVLECFQRTPLNPDVDWTSFLEALARQAAIAIENARLLDDLQISNRELRELAIPPWKAGPVR
jgi:GAF domain-containing protein